MEGKADDVAERVFALFTDKPAFQIGTSSHVIDGYYYVSTLFGFQIRLEPNSYDYDDKYKYMLRIAIDPQSSVHVDAIIMEYVTNAIIALLRKNLSAEIAHESKDGKLIVFVYPLM